MRSVSTATVPRVTTEDVQRASELLEGVVGRYLSQLRVGAGDVQLVFDNGTFVRLAGTTRLDDGPGTEEPQSLAGLAILLPLLNETVVSAGVRQRGALAVAFKAGVLRCDPDEKYEAWEFTTESGAMVVCMGGGELAIWSERPQAQPEVVPSSVELRWRPDGVRRRSRGHLARRVGQFR